MKNFQLKIITPERVLFDEVITQVSLPTLDGEITVLANHMPLLSVIGSGEVRIIKQDGGLIPIVISGGFCEINDTRFLLLADTAERVEELDILRAEEAQKRAQERLNEKNLDSKEYAYLIGKIDKELARIRVGRKYRP